MSLVEFLLNLGISLLSVYQFENESWKAANLKIIHLMRTQSFPKN